MVADPGNRQKTQRWQGISKEREKFTARTRETPEVTQTSCLGVERCGEDVHARRKTINKGLPRSFDVIVSLIGLVLSAPLLLLSAVILALTPPGGVLFSQKRVGRNGEMFVLYKLRTMRASNTGPEVTSGDDTRITRVGRLLRKTKLDELPTLWNVLKGDMAFVGPRPEVPRYVNLQDPMWQEVLATRPGITDPVTLQLRNEEGLLAQVKSDTEKYYLNDLQPLKLKGYMTYLEGRSWRSDLKVLLQTLVAVVIPQRPSTDFTDSISG